MTPQQRRAFDFVDAFLAKYGHSPSLDEIAGHLGVASKSSAHRVVEALIERGYLRREEYGRQRALEIMRRPGLTIATKASLSAIASEDLRAELARRGEMA